MSDDAQRPPLASGGRLLPPMKMATRPQDWAPTARSIIFGNVYAVSVEAPLPLLDPAQQERVRRRLMDS